MTSLDSLSGPGTPFALAPEALRCPYRHYEQIRAAGPAVWLPALDAFAVSSFQQIQTVLRQPLAASSRTPTGPHVGAQVAAAVERAMVRGPLTPRVAAYLAQPPDPTLFTIDPPDHTRQRRAVARMFAPDRVARWEPWAVELAGDAVRAMAAAGSVDLAADFAHRIALGLTVRVLGLELTDHARMQRWADEVVAVIGNPDPSDEAILHMLASRVEMAEVFADLIARRRAEPADDLTTAVAFTATEAAPVEGVVLTESERIGLLINFHVAGTESTAKLIVNCAVTLAQRPDLWAALTADRSLVPPFVEEMLRLEPPSQGMYRCLTEPLEVAGQVLPAGSHLYLMYAAGNRDPDEFAQPEHIVLDRPNGTRHLSFGHGVHLCLGAPVARMEARVAVNSLLDGLAGLTLGDLSEAEYLPSYLLHGLVAAPAVAHPR